MKKSEYTLAVNVYDSAAELDSNDSWLLNEALAASDFAYAPYSNFRVGAAAVLTNGEVVTGSNQENASYPAGICAERVVLSAASSQHPGIGVATIAVTYQNAKGNSNTPITPCGICRQSLAEHQQRFGSPIRVILGGKQVKVLVIENAAQLIPMAFGPEDLK